MMSVATPIASVPAAHAVHTAVTGPRRPSSIDTWPAPMLATLRGIANGETRSGPRSSITRCCSSREIAPEPPLAMIAPIPAPSLSMGMPESATARRAAATASWAYRSMRREARRSMKSVGSNPWASQAIRTG